MAQRIIVALVGFLLLGGPAAADPLPAVGKAPASVAQAGQADSGRGAPVVALAENVGFPPPEYSRDLLAAYQRSIDSRRPMVVIFAPPWSGFSNKLKSEVLVAPSFRERYEGRGIFVAVDPDKDDSAGNVAKMIRELGIDQYPVVAVLDARTTSIKERGRVTGYYPLATFVGHLDRVLATASTAAAAPAR